MSVKTPWAAAIEVEPKTESERYLSKLARKAFLSLWCYGNVHTDEGKKSVSGDGKELCDLFVVFGDHILIFSDKHCEYPTHPDPLVSWGRWYKRAVHGSVVQLIGAEKFIREHPDRLYLDKQCAVPFPYRLPDMDKAVFHRIAVTRGSRDAAVAHWRGQSSCSLMIDTTLTDKKQHLETPFTVGWPAGKGRFVHVLDELTLDVLLSELDTVPDLMRYFSEKEHFLSSAEYMNVAGEEELITLYQTNVQDGKHTLPRDFPESNMIVLAEGDWEVYDSSVQRRARNEANRLSYFWDEIIEFQSRYIRSDEAVAINGESYSNDEMEQLVRALAMEGRFARRVLGDALHEVLRRPVPLGSQSTRIMPSPTVDGRYYVFTVVPRDQAVDYQIYREDRAEFLVTYCNGLRLRYPDIIEAVGLASEPFSSKASSQDVLYMAFPEPATVEELDILREQCDELGILQERSMRPYAFHASEYPRDFGQFGADTGFAGNRAERRAQASAQRKAEKKAKRRKPN
ncbi:hypothetical protein KVG95_29120 [Pseudomonas sp. SWRI79]|uniref:Uncharacterized protein n=1 Tax=Pseudomonas farris TaxID=2841207 RepID=A0ABS6Q4P0_9PSED|nr:hypothetical protein [Pseudomonas farris]MBV4467381.1 hypothetical protein [Pseudomonas farris]